MSAYFFMAKKTLINVAFSGTGFLFPVHIGAVKALEDNDVLINGYAGTSGGSIIAALCALGYKSDDMLSVIDNVDFSKLITFNPTALFNMAICDGRSVERLLRDLIGDKTFSDLEHSLYITATDLNSNEAIVFSKRDYPDMPIWLAVRASMTYPFVFTPVRYDGMVLVDGGLSNYTPINLFGKQSKLKTLGFQLTTDQGEHFFSEVRFLPAIAVRMVSMLVSNMNRLHIKLSTFNVMSKMVFIDKGDYGTLDTNINSTDVKELVSKGYKATESQGLPFLY